MPSKELTIFRLHMKDALLAAQKGEGELAILYQEVANDVTAKVEARGDKVTALELQADIDEAFQKTAFKRIKIVKASIENGAKLGPKASKETMRAAYGEEVARAQVRSSKKAFEEAANRIAGKTAVDGVAVSKRMRKVDKQVSAEMAREVERGIRQKKGILGAARKIEKLDPRAVRLPKYLQEVEAAARAGNVDGLKKLTAQYTRYAEGLGEVQADLTRKASKYSLRTATQRFLKDVEKSGADGVDKIVQKYVTEKAAFRANLIARHETVEAFRRSYIEQSKNKPGVVGMAWKISPTRHGNADECDVYANQNAYKLGPGVYPADKVPKHPHPACIPAGALVETERGLVLIEDIRPGMRVRTHTGALRSVLRLSVLPWRGELVIATIGDKRLIATPEHPLLTTRGWVPADEISPGDWVFARINAHDAPAYGAEVTGFVGIHAPLPLSSMPVAGIDLYREQQALNSCVDVVFADSQLTDHCMTFGAYGTNDACLMRCRFDALPRRSAQSHAFECVLTSPSDGVRSCNHRMPSLGSAARRGNELLLGSGALLDAASREHAVDRRARDADARRGFQNASLRGYVEPNYVIDDGARMRRHGTRDAALSTAGSALPSLASGWHVRRRDDELLALGAQRNAFAREPILDDVKARAEQLCNGADRSLIADVQVDHLADVYIGARAAATCSASGHFQASQVVGVARRAFDGVVHNFAVDVDESYVVDGIVTHNCLCSVTVVLDRHHFKRGKAENDNALPPPLHDDKSPDAIGWLKANDAVAAKILGPTRHALMHQGVSVLDGEGKPLRVRDLLPRRERAAQ
jgi:hypothetical protein